MAHLVTDDAEADLDEIWLYLAKASGSIDVATRAVDSITDRFFVLSKFPFAGRSCEDELGAGVAQFFSWRGWQPWRSCSGCKWIPFAGGKDYFPSGGPAFLSAAVHTARGS
jgi:plasmid stabilization system protein ParE